ncbi:DUF305 domain-containing protein [Psychrobacter sp. FDAARGOS_221]|uniref:CopM family metallochaperone n=1 Tax=Psychrobacter sp. FDAARGOS_221 TaxID=1975705 RepID=UPI001D0D576E|nr:DUF305 domain-containing protein [Psychrobacter sp. FDAARGOS_221]
MALSACQPNTDENTDQTQPSDVESTEVAADNEEAAMANDHAEHDQQISDDHQDHDANTSATTEFGKAYMADMDGMHQDMMQALTANDADVAFAKGMLPHHEGAIDMAEVQLKYGKDDTMRKLAQDVIDAQQAEIDQMKAWLDEHPDTEEQEYTKQMQQAYSSSMNAMHDDMIQGLLSDDADIAFAKGMLAHHQGAVDMAKVQLEYGKDDAMRQLAEDIISAQQAEIELMQQWISEHES